MTTSSTPPLEQMQVVAGSTYLQDNAFQSTTPPPVQKSNKSISFIGPAFILFGISVMSFALSILYSLPALSWLILPGALLLFGIAFQQYRKSQPKKKGIRPKKEIADINFYKGLKGEFFVEKSLAKIFDSNWTLYKNVLLTIRTDDIDAILVGPLGVFVLEVKAYSGKFRYDGKVWEYLQKNAKWGRDDKNPMVQLVSNRNRVYRHFKEKGLEVPVSGRLVWVGDGYVSVPKHTRDIWFIRNEFGAKWIRDDIGRNKPVESERLEKVHAELTRISIRSRLK